MSSSMPRPPRFSRRKKMPRRTATVHFVLPENKTEPGRLVRPPSPPSSPRTSMSSVVV
uniref:Uncharacterized protein n=1 Tax=Triticum urartu TaxID=4572 RepID=A0A8R7Q1Z9_TRIUA